MGKVAKVPLDHREGCFVPDLIIVCRLRVTPDDLAHVLPAMLPKKGNPAAGAVEQTEVFRRLELPPEDLQRLRLRQQQNARIFERQKSRVHFPSPLLPLSAGSLTEHH